MIQQLDEVRAMLTLFAKSPWQDLHLRSGEWTMFFAKPGGAHNPLQGVPVASGGELAAVTAPHLGLFTASVALGEAVAAGDAVGQIEVLGDKTDVTSEIVGRVAAIDADGGVLVEYGASLVRLAAA
jgi:acetyl-CoA carboxylase biotin carboxyl carrier protein